MGYAEITWSAIYSVASPSQFDKGDNFVYGRIKMFKASPQAIKLNPFVYGRMKTPNASPQAIELNPRCFGLGHFKGHKTGPGNENMKHGCAFRILRAPSIILPLNHAGA